MRKSPRVKQVMDRGRLTMEEPSGPSLGGGSMADRARDPKKQLQLGGMSWPIYTFIRRGASKSVSGKVLPQPLCLCLCLCLCLYHCHNETSVWVLRESASAFASSGAVSDPGRETARPVDLAAPRNSQEDETMRAPFFLLMRADVACLEGASLEVGGRVCWWS